MPGSETHPLASSLDFHPEHLVKTSHFILFALVEEYKNKCEPMQTCKRREMKTFRCYKSNGGE